MEHTEYGDGSGDDLHAGVIEQCFLGKYLRGTLQPDHGPVAGGF